MPEEKKCQKTSIMSINISEKNSGVQKADILLPEKKSDIFVLSRHHLQN